MSFNSDFLYEKSISPLLAIIRSGERDFSYYSIAYQYTECELLLTSASICNSECELISTHTSSCFCVIWRDTAHNPPLIIIIWFILSLSYVLFCPFLPTTSLCCCMVSVYTVVVVVVVFVVIDRYDTIPIIYVMCAATAIPIL